MDNTILSKFIPHLIIIIFYIFTLSTSGKIVYSFVGIHKEKNIRKENRRTFKLDTGSLIGKCENILTITLILLQAYTSLGIIFAAKSIVRIELIKKDPRYYLGGTLINFTYSVIIGLIIRVLIKNLGYPLIL